MHIKELQKTTIVFYCNNTKHCRILDQIVEGFLTPIISGLGDNKTFHFGKLQVNIDIFYVNDLNISVFISFVYIKTCGFCKQVKTKGLRLVNSDFYTLRLF